MSAVAKLVAFGVVLLAAFSAAVVAGGAIGPERDGERSAAAAAHGEDASRADGSALGGDGRGASDHGGDEGAAGDHAAASRSEVAGLAVSDRALTLDLARTQLPRGRATELRFTIDDEHGRPVRDFDIAHEKRMHVIVVRRDGRGFQHVHPVLERDGTWHTRLTLPDAGAYRVFADFERGGEKWTLGADLHVDGDAAYSPLPDSTMTTDAGDGYAVRLDAKRAPAGRESELRFHVTRDGQPVRTEPYLGAGGHLVALREGDLAYLHTHPTSGHGDTVTFATTFPTAERYRLYLQFQHEGRVRTAELTYEVSR